MKWAEKAIASKLHLLGQDALLKGDGVEWKVQAIIDPVESRSQNAMETDMQPDGYYPPGSYQYFGPPDATLEGVDRVESLGKTYYIRRRELYSAGGKALYWWALMIRGGEDCG